MKAFNIHMTGVGGQGIGLLSQALLRGIDHAGVPAIAVDTHGLAQRGGVVVSRIRCGTGIHSPLIMKQQADLVLGMEVHEAARAMDTALKHGGTLVFMDVSWQPLPVRLGLEKPVQSGDIAACKDRCNAHIIQVKIAREMDPQMQNMALLGTVAKNCLVPGVLKSHYIAALEDLLTGQLLKTNLTVFHRFADE